MLNGLGVINANLFTLGSVIIGERFETKVIPEITVQALDIAKSTL
jgi:hypothetical protein